MEVRNTYREQILMEVIRSLGSSKPRLERFEDAYSSLLKLTKETETEQVFIRRDDICKMIQAAKLERQDDKRQKILDDIADSFAGFSFSHAWNDA
jgi:hypothetical protein